MCRARSKSVCGVFPLCLGGSFPASFAIVTHPIIHMQYRPNSVEQRIGALFLWSCLCVACFILCLDVSPVPSPTPAPSRSPPVSYPITLPSSPLPPSPSLPAPPCRFNFEECGGLGYHAAKKKRRKRLREEKEPAKVGEDCCPVFECSSSGPSLFPAGGPSGAAASAADAIPDDVQRKFATTMYTKMFTRMNTRASTNVGAVPMDKEQDVWREDCGKSCTRDPRCRCEDGACQCGDGAGASGAGASGAGVSGASVSGPRSMALCPCSQYKQGFCAPATEACDAMVIDKTPNAKGGRSQGESQREREREREWE